MAETTSDKLQGILNSKEAIRKAINEKGVECDKSVLLSKYAEKIRAIGQGGGSGLGLKIPGTIYSYAVGTYSGTPLQIINQPTDFTGAVNKKAFFVVEAIGKKLTYQWQWCPADGDTWSNSGQDGNATSILSVTITEARNGQKYRCIITNSDGTQTTSNVCVLHVE